MENYKILARWKKEYTDTLVLPARELPCEREFGVGVIAPEARPGREQMWLTSSSVQRSCRRESGALDTKSLDIPSACRVHAMIPCAGTLTRLIS
jgi:hypothetical protein